MRKTFILRASSQRENDPFSPKLEASSISNDKPSKAF